MRVQLAALLALATTVAACSSTPPAPAPMVMADPAPATMTPAPAAGPVDGLYKGTAALVDGAPRSCRKAPKAVSVRVRSNSFTLAGMRGTVAPDGSIATRARRGGSMTGTVSGGTMDVTTMSGRCGTRYTLTHA